MTEQFKYLFTPLKIGSITVRNRLLITAHASLFCDSESLFSERDACFYAERAKGGVGLIITGGTHVHPTSTANRLYAVGYKDEAIPRYRMMADMVHEHGAHIIIQLRHRGSTTDGAVFDDFRQVWAPSAIVGLGDVAKEMEVEDIEEVVEAFAVAAARVRESGADGVELHGASGYLIEQFLSPITNKRTDEYGGSLENRMRFAFQIVDRVRERCGRDFTVGMRIVSDELSPSGLSLDDMTLFAQRLEATGKVDFLDTVAGNPLYTHLTVPAMNYPQGFAVPLTSAIKRAVQNIPVFTVGRIVDPIFAEKVLADGHADMVGMTRAHICDPELGNKAREGRLDQIRTCVGCNQGCVGRNRASRPIACVQNVGAGREKQLGVATMRPAERKKRVLVVGGGPAGMEAARVAALRGHSVTLYEKADELGGQVVLATRVRHREEWGGVARNLIRAINRLDVGVKLGMEVTPELVRSIGSDAVIVATGSTPLKTGFMTARAHLPGIPGAEQDNVVTTFDVLQGKVQVGSHVVVIDDEGHQRSNSTVQYLVDQGVHVELITRNPTIAFNLGVTGDQPEYYRTLPEQGVIFHTSTDVKAIEGNTVIVSTTYTGEEKRIEGVDHVVMSTLQKANNGLYKALKGQVKELYAVGDCVQPRKVAEAIYEGHMAARKI